MYSYSHSSEHTLQQRNEDLVSLEQKMMQTMAQKDKERRQIELANNQNIENVRKLKGVLSEIRQRYRAEIVDLRRGMSIPNTPSQYTLSSHPANTSSQHAINTQHSSHTLNARPIIIYTLSSHFQYIHVYVYLHLQQQICTLCGTL